MAGSEVDAWLLHLAEGVRDDDRRPGDPVSSRGEFATLKAKGLLTDMTVVVHGTALERTDFAEMRAAPSIRTDGAGDGRGAKLVWSPLSNLLLYGKTTNVYEALAEGVLTSLGTDWTPSGSRTLLQELKIADVALRDDRVLGASRELVPAFSPAGRPASCRSHRLPPAGAGYSPACCVEYVWVDRLRRRNRQQQAPICRHFTRRERRDSNPRPPA
jgi:hypothetical protein